MTPTEELHALILDIVGDDDAATIAAKVGVTHASARRWRARYGFIPPSRSAMQRMFDAYAVSFKVQRRVMALYSGCIHAT